MCGIFGMYLKGKGKLSRDEVIRLTRLMNHRGPDNEGYFVADGVGLGHKRLSIIDLAGGHQPLFNEDGNLCIIFNGEIYNYMDLRRELEGAGHRFTTKSDTEVILHAYEEFGNDCLRRFYGIFAFAIYDQVSHTLFLGRDHIGVKPLYYYEDDEFFIFSSEIKPIIASAHVHPRLNTEMVDFFFSLGYTPSPQTLFEGILKIPPAGYARIEREKTEIGNYWSLVEFNERPISLKHAVMNLRDLFFKVVEEQLVSEVSIGVFLSGGLDSSAVVAAMQKAGRKDIKTFSVGYPEHSQISELKYARQVSELFKTSHYEYHLSHGDFFDSVENLLGFAEEPIVESAAIALYQLALHAKKEATVLLSGEGADELFAGYPLHRQIPMLKKIWEITRIVPERIGTALAQRLPYSEKIIKYLEWGHHPIDGWYHTVSSDVTSGIRRMMYTSKFLSSANGKVDSFFKETYSKVKGRSDLAKMLYVDTQYWLPDDLLLKADKMTMAASIELRVPFLDPRLVEFAASLPDFCKISKGEGKYVLKKAMEGILPNEIIYRRKRGFPVPIREWFRRKLYDKVREVILSDQFIAREIFAPEYLRWILESHLEGREDHSRRIFSLLVFELWTRKYIC